MTPVRQTAFGDGTKGDCLRAAAAAVLDLPLAAVPHFLVLGQGGWQDALRAWLRGRDLDFRIIYSAPAGYAVAIGPRGNNYHAVVECDGRLAHDPNGGRGLDAAHCWLVIEPINYELERAKRRRAEGRRNRARFGIEF